MAEREIIPLPGFSKRIKELIADHKLKLEDFNTFKSVLAENPEMGERIQGTGGVRKTRLKSASKGKRGGFRVCYYYHDLKTGKIFLITIYPKNEKDNVSPDEKKELKVFADIIKKKV